MSKLSVYLQETFTNVLVGKIAEHLKMEAHVVVKLLNGEMAITKQLALDIGKAAEALATQAGSEIVAVHFAAILLLKQAESEIEELGTTLPDTVKAEKKQARARRPKGEIVTIRKAATPFTSAERVPMRAQSPMYPKRTESSSF